MKKLLFITLLSLPLTCIGQQWEYASILRAIAIGQKATFHFTDYDSTNHYGKFKTEIDAMNFASKRGWEFVQAYSPANNLVEYILRRKRIDANHYADNQDQKTVD